ncbi:TlpA disulfide reductase family protein [Brevundimonas sp. SORGH_AS_0993]|uniref:TlpA family protein disulfide reductase n=1 Tax=Brevundimonas sp. SORGH_AS_0993 TaxID=3041794 RepID=UPI002783090F|nr:TlpA disulfide reductase family protein [Brevundimonas sp. SORGH_AS_0993]MDQ1154700.1 thiol-disulfide isomerase/thioredoxin [Brevundimonas sp. SORGH_AS_0993]
MSGSRKAIWAVVGAIVLVSTIAGAGGMAISLYANHRQAAQAPTAPAIDKAGDAAAPSDLTRFAVGAMARLQTPAEPKPAPGYVFRDRTGTAVRFQAFEGRVTVVNLWAMWCAPCRAEMPTLAALARSYEANPDLIVLPINVDATPDGVTQAKTFIDAHAPLPFYNDVRFQLPFEFPGKGMMPQTIILDRQGRIRASLAGDADWNSAQARALIDALLAESAPTA